VPSSSDPSDVDLTINRELFWIAHRSRGNGGGQPEDVPRRWRDVQGEERRALMPIYDAFMKGYAAPVNGTLLREWIDHPLIENLTRAGYLTVEDLANAPQNNVAGCGMGCLALQRKAQEYVTQGESTRAVSASLAAANAKIAELQAQMEKFSAQTEKPKNKGGRPRREPLTQQQDAA